MSRKSLFLLTDFLCFIALSEKLFNINPLNNNNGDWKTYRFQDNAEKYKIFTACINEFKHTIVNSRLHEINTINDLIEYFLTPVDTLDFLSKLKSDLQNDHNGKLPPNLNIQVEPIRYNPNEDDFFKVNAYPGRSTIVSNLAACKKFSSYRVSRTKRLRVEYEDM
ncbi:unnamed protein product [Heterobilharzia americana]|nr:unnamed protein product [Heterobilharzia americana]